MYFDEQTASAVFRKLWLEGRYDFILEDLVALANAFAESAKPQIAKEERQECIKYVNSLNTYVAKALREKREYS